MTVAARPARGGPTLLQDALITIVTRFGLAVLIFSTDIVLAHLLGPDAKGRFTLVLLFSVATAVALPAESVPSMMTVLTRPPHAPLPSRLMMRTRESRPSAGNAASIVATGSVAFQLLDVFLLSRAS